MSKITAGQMRAQLDTIAKKISAGYTDQDIMTDLHLKRSTFYVYKHRMFKVYGDIAAKKTQESLEFEAEILKDRYVRMFRNLEARLTKGEATTADALGTQVAADVATNIFRLEVEGYRARQGVGLKALEQKAVKYLGNIQPKLSEPDYTPDKDDDEEIRDPVSDNNDSDGTAQGQM